MGPLLPGSCAATVKLTSVLSRMSWREIAFSEGGRLLPSAHGLSPSLVKRKLDVLVIGAQLLRRPSWVAVMVVGERERTAL